MFGFKATEVIGKNVSLLMPSPHAEKHNGFLARYLQTGEKKIIDIGREVVARKKNGTLFPVELSVGEVINKGQRLFTGFIRDLTEHRISEKQITELQNELIHVARYSAMGELATTLSHELNQPLTAIANYTLVTRQLVSKLGKAKKTKPVLDLLDKAAIQAQRAGEIIRSIRTFIKHHENKFLWENIEDAVREAVKIATIGTDIQRIDVQINKSGPVPDVCMDRIQIQQVVTNLVRNAVDAVCEQDGERIVRIEINRHGHRSVIVRVIDNGPGISANVEQRLFETFNSSKSEGVGIGLAISKTIVTSHNGEIRGKNREEGGAEFYFVLPIDSEAEEIGKAPEYNQSFATITKRN
jgi:two-component system sensor kinase FixL